MFCPAAGSTRDECWLHCYYMLCNGGESTYRAGISGGRHLAPPLFAQSPLSFPPICEDEMGGKRNLTLPCLAQPNGGGWEGAGEKKPPPASPHFGKKEGGSQTRPYQVWVFRGGISGSPLVWCISCISWSPSSFVYFVFFVYFVVLLFFRVFRGLPLPWCISWFPIFFRVFRGRLTRRWLRARRSSPGGTA
jgi:hypothetical protein